MFDNWADTAFISFYYLKGSMGYVIKLVTVGVDKNRDEEARIFKIFRIIFLSKPNVFIKTSVSSLSDEFEELLRKRRRRREDKDRRQRLDFVHFEHRLTKMDRLWQG